MANRCVIFDKDGTLIHNNRSKNGGHYYIKNPDDSEWVDGALELLELFRDGGYKIYLITMQNWIKAKDDFCMMKAVMNKIMGCNLIDDYKICQSIEETDESKALSKMQAIMQLSAQYDIDIMQSIGIGDTHSDMLAYQKANLGISYQIVLPYGDPASDLADKMYRSLIDLHADFVFNRLTGGLFQKEYSNAK